MNPSETGTVVANKASLLQALSLRALLIALAGIVAVHAWDQKGTPGYYASGITSDTYPVGAFLVFVLIVLFNLLAGRLKPGRQLRPAELLVIYAMLTVGTVVAGGTQAYTIVSTLPAAFYFASPENRWAEFFPLLKPWLFPQPLAAVRGFFEGNAPVPWGAWLTPGLVWCGVLFLLGFGTLCIAIALRRQWIESERLVFPTTALPLAMISSPRSFFANRLMWLGFSIPFFLGTLTTLSLNYPTLPGIDIRGQFTDLNKFFVNQPWKSAGWTPITYYPLVAGVGYLISSDVSLSLWVFYLFRKAEIVLAAALGVLTESRVVFPWIGYQGTGAYFWIFVVALWTARRHLAAMLLPGRFASAAAPREIRAGRLALAGWFVSFLLLTAFLVACGVRPAIAAVTLLLVFAFYTVAARIICEAGVPWLFGPVGMPREVVVRSAGDAFFRPRELLTLQVVDRIAGWNVRALPMPHQFIALKMAHSLRTGRRGLVLAMVLALAVGLAISFFGHVMNYYHVGFLAQGDDYAIRQTQVPFDLFRSASQSPAPADSGIAVGVGVGFAFAGLLTFLRTRLLGFPLHPLGFAVAESLTLWNCWFPFFIAWSLKTVVLRYGGSALYRRSLPLCLGVILGDLTQGGLWTLIAYFVPGFNANPINW